jgi:hypothetical protein
MYKIIPEQLDEKQLELETPRQEKYSASILDQKYNG